MHVKDKLERDKIEKDLDTTFMVEAGAGAGKTTSLVRRMINQILEGKFNIENIAAITFTKKAATELKERFQMELENSVDINLTDIQRNRIEQALRDINLCYIGTIHSFCNKLLKERPIEGKVSLDFEEMDESESNKFKNNIWYDFLDNTYKNRPEIILEFKKHDLNPKLFKDTYLEMCKYHPNDIVIACENDDTLNDDIENYFNEIKTKLTNLNQHITYKEDGMPDYKWQINVLNNLQEINTINSIQQKSQFIKKADEILKGSIGLKKCEDPDMADKDIRITKDLIKEYQKSLKDKEDITNNFEKYKMALNFIKEARDFYYKEKENSGKLAFEDLLVKARDMLRDNSEIRKYFGDKYKYLLVDEFQDTDPIQAEIMFFLTGIQTEEKDWRKIRIKQGALFIVGDPKQSIYRFRNADISLYNQVKELIIDSSGEILQLTTNFRTYKETGEWFNEKFKDLLGEHTTNYQSQFSRMNFCKESNKKTISGVKILSIEEKETPEKIAKHIHNIIKNKSEIDIRIDGKNTTRLVEPKDFMILTDKKSKVKDYKCALEKINIPCYSTGLFSLGEYESINSLLSLIKYIANTEDEISLVGALKGIYGISDQMLLDSKYYGLSFSIYNNIEHLDINIKNELNPLLNAYKDIKKYVELKNVINPISLLNIVIQGIKVLPWSLSLEDEKYAYKELYQIIEQLRNSEDDSKFDFIKMVEKFDNLCNEQVEEISELDTSNKNAVRIMNVHKSKGLEAPIVILVSENSATKKEIKSHLSRSVDGNIGYFPIIINKSIGLKPFKWTEMELEENKYIEAEKIRLQYVAATRAGNVLYIVSTGKNDSKNIYKDLYDTETDIEFVDDNEIIDVEIKKEDIEITKEENWQTNHNKSKYAFKSPTQDEKIESKAKIESGGSQELGTIIHKVFEEIVKGNSNINELIEFLISESKQHKNDIEKVRLAVDKFNNSELIDEIKNSTKVYPETKFSICINKESNLYDIYAENEEYEEIYLNGVIDLVININGKYKIIDYKTDQVSTIEDAKLRALDYEKQVKTYAKVWKELTGQDVDEVLLYFSYLGQVIKL